MAVLVPGPTGHAMAQRLATQLGGHVASTEFRTFPDGERYARILAPVEGEDVVVVQTGHPVEHLWTTLMLLEAAHGNGARHVRAVVPYLPYARQDRLFQPGEAVTARLVGRLVRTYAAATVTVDLHKADVARFFDGRCTNVSSAPAFAEALKARRVDVVLAPDAGARARADEVAGLMGARSDHLEKRRISADLVEMKAKALDVHGSRVAILDDIISTGGTMAKAAEQLIAAGAAAVLCAGVHGLFIGDCLAKLKTAGVSEVVVSDTIETPQSRVSVAPLVGEALAAHVRA